MQRQGHGPGLDVRAGLGAVGAAVPGATAPAALGVRAAAAAGAPGGAPGGVPSRVPQCISTAAGARSGKGNGHRHGHLRQPPGRRALQGITTAGHVRPISLDPGAPDAAQECEASLCQNVISMPAEPGSSSTSPGSGRPPRTARGQADPTHPPFTGYLERDALRKSRELGRRRTLVISIAVHVLVFASLLVYSLFQVDELWAPSVEVKVFSPGKLPAGVNKPRPPDPGDLPGNPATTP